MLKRPTYHLSPDQWINDPIPFYWEGVYHLFFQHNPKGAWWGNICWGHATSSDLIHWNQHDIALSPTPYSGDQQGCWTGCLFHHDGDFHIFYTGVTEREYPNRSQFNPIDSWFQTLCRASSPDLFIWSSLASDPLTITPPAHSGDCFRDPHVWKEGHRWHLIIGGEQKQGTGGAIFRYTSEDWKTWDSQGTFYHQPSAKGDWIECPDFFKLGTQHILLVSSQPKGLPLTGFDKRCTWIRGEYHNSNFLPIQQGALDTGYFYAAKSTQGPDGRRLLWGWIPERISETDQRKRGWSGNLSLPREIRTLPDGQMRIVPIPEIQALRHATLEIHLPRVDSASQTSRFLFPHQVFWNSEHWEALINFNPENCHTCGLQFEYGSQSLVLKYHHNRSTFQGQQVSLDEDGQLRLHIFRDGSILEIFANEQVCHTHRLYEESLATHLELRLFVEQGWLPQNQATFWQLVP